MRLQRIVAVLAVAVLFPASAWAQNPPDQPKNVTPIHGLITVDDPATTTGSDVVLSATSYSDPDDVPPGTDAQGWSRWQVDDDPLFGSVDIDSLVGGAGNSNTLTGTALLADNTTYYWRVMYSDSAVNWSPWSEPTRFRYSMNAYVWNGSTDDFSLSGNWLVGGSPPASAPGSADDVIVQMWGPDPKLYSPTTIKSLFISDANQSVTLFLNGNTLDVLAGFAMDGPGWAVGLDMTNGLLYVGEDFFVGQGSTVTPNFGAATETIFFNGSTPSIQELRTPGGFYGLPHLQVITGTGFARKFDILGSISIPSLIVDNDRYVRVQADVSCGGDVIAQGTSVLEVGKPTPSPVTLFVAGNLSTTGGTQLRLLADATVDMDDNTAPPNSFVVNGSFVTSNPIPPVITTSTGPFYSMQLNGAIDVKGLDIDYVDSGGLQIGGSATITNFKNVQFLNGQGGAGPGITFNAVGSQQYRLVNVAFDAGFAQNIRTLAGFTGEVRCMLDPGVPGLPWGGAFENDGDAGTVEPGGTITWIPGYVLKTVSASGTNADHPSFTSAVSSLIALSPLDVPHVVQALDGGPYAEQICLTGVSVLPGVPLEFRGNPATDTLLDATGFTRGIHVDGVPGVTIQDFNVANILGVSGGGIAVIHVENGSTDVTIMECDIYNLGAGTIGILVETGSDSPLITDNEIDGSGGIEGITVAADAPQIDHNVIWGAAYGINLLDDWPSNAAVFHNTVYVPGWAFALENVWNPSGVQVYNNIFVSTAAPGAGGGMYIPSGFSGPSPNPFSGGRSDYNAFFMPGGAPVSGDGSATTNLTLAAHQAWTLGQDANSFAGIDPLFLSVAAGDFHLQSSAGTFNEATDAHDLFPPAYSPFLDAGDPFTPYGNEPWPSFGPELGAYGDTPEASFSDSGAPVVTVLFPAGGEVLTGSFAISWSTVDQSFGTVSILLSNDGGVTFPFTLASGIPDTGAFTWDSTTSPDGPSYAYVIQVTATDLSGQTGTAWSGAFILDHTPPTVAWTYPVGGEILVGVPWISWTTADANPFQANVFLSSDSGATFPVVVASGIPDGGGIVFDTTLFPNGTTYRLRVDVWDAVGNTASATTPADFAIDNTGAPTYLPLTPTSPFFGATVYWSDVWLQWVAEPTAVDYKIEVSPDPFFTSVTEFFSAWPEYTLTGLTEGTVFWRVSFLAGGGAAAGWSAPGPMSTFNVLFTPFPGTISVTLTGGTTVGAYRMIGFPASTSGWDAVAQMEAVLGPYDTVQWRSFRWDATAGAYDEFPFGSFDPNTDAAGMAAWVLSRNTMSFTAAGYDTSPADYWTIMLEPGWNQVGDPYLAPVSWSSVLVSDGFSTYYAADPSNPLLVPYAYFFDGAYSSAVELTPYYGVFVYVNAGSSGPLMLIVPRPASLLKAGRETRPPSTQPLPAGAPLPPSPPGGSGGSSSGSSGGGGGGGGGCTAGGAAAGWALLAGLCLAVGLASSRHRVP